MATMDLQLPPGFRFHPSDEELVHHYLCRKCASKSIAVPIIAEIDLYKYDPWELPGLALYGEKEWYFFSPRDRKYPNGSRPNRAAGRGYWKATGADKPVGKPKAVGIKKALVFYSGKAPRGEKTNWIMHEYRLADVDRSASKNKNSLRLDDWVLCRIYNKKGSVEKQHDVSSRKMASAKDVKPVALASVPKSTAVVYDDFVYSEHAVSPEGESATTKLAEWERAAVDFPFSYMDVSGGGGASLISSHLQESDHIQTMTNDFADVARGF